MPFTVIVTGRPAIGTPSGPESWTVRVVAPCCSCGADVIVSVEGSVLTIETLNDCVTVTPRRSVVVQTTVVVPSKNVEPDGGRHATGRLPSTTLAAVAT